MPCQASGTARQQHRRLAESVDQPGVGTGGEGIIVTQAVNTCFSCLPSFYTPSPENRCGCSGWDRPLFLAPG